MAPATGGFNLAVSGESAGSSSAGPALLTDGGGVDAFAAAMQGARTEGTKSMPLPQPILKTALASKSPPPRDDANPSQPRLVPVPSGASTAPGGGGGPNRGDDSCFCRTPPEGHPSYYVSLGKGLTTMGGGLVKVLKGFGLVNDQKEKNKESQEVLKKSMTGQEHQNEEDENQSRKHEQSQTPAEDQFCGLLSHGPEYVNNAVLIVEGMDEIVSGFKDARTVVGPRISSLGSVVLSALKNSTDWIQPTLSYMKSVISPRQATVKNPQLDVVLSSLTSIEIHPRHCCTCGTGLRALLRWQTPTRPGNDRVLVVSDFYGKESVLPGVRIVNNLAQLQAAVCQLSFEKTGEKIDVNKGNVSLNEASAMWTYLWNNCATGLVAPDSTLTSMTWQYNFIKYDLNNIESNLQRATSVVEELENKRKTLTAKLNDPAPRS